MVPKYRPEIDWENNISSVQLESELLHSSPRDTSDPVDNDLIIFTEIPRISVVIPSLNEADNLPFVLPKIPTWVSEVILVDGHSSDDTVRVARQLLPDIHVVEQRGRGKGDALRTGFKAAQGDIIVMLDADGSTDPAAISTLVTCLLSGVDYAKGSRFLPSGGTADMGWLRQLGNWGFVMMVRQLFGGKFTDLCFGYNAFWKDVLGHISLTTDGFEIETELNIQVLRANLWIVEVPCFEAARIHGASNLKTFRDGWRVLRTIIRQYRQVNRLGLPTWLDIQKATEIL